MAGMKKVKASSLLETIVALMVIMLVFGVAMTIYLNVVRSGDTIASFNASQKLSELSEAVRKDKSYFDETLEEETITITKKISSYQNTENLILMELEAVDKTGKRLAVRRELLLKDDL